MQGLVLLLVFFGTAHARAGDVRVHQPPPAQRVGHVAAAHGRRRADRCADRANILRDLRRSSLPALDRLLDSMAVSEALDYELRRAGASWSVGEFVLGSAIAASFLLLHRRAMGLLTAWLGAMLGAVAPFVVAAPDAEAPRRRSSRISFPTRST